MSTLNLRQAPGRLASLLSAWVHLVVLRSRAGRLGDPVCLQRASLETTVVFAQVLLPKTWLSTAAIGRYHKVRM